ncbi:MULTISPECIES: hypothetical protein [Comamonas]|uniref:hypothetical protein n=1 Tax=Comamonas TaxID=283 RepID=UPI0006319E2F|nr:MULTISPECIES: hypothetical protein [Comamonas]GAO72889.1 hypothetical protein CSE6_027_43260 [Comamonas sp. E6]CUB01367.1 hypothetical protein Ga0061062_11373 [Comamonas thiooxydans]
MSAASLIANHMNVPYGKIVSEEDVAASFRHGRLSASNLEANAILAFFFNEIEPSLIIRCAREVGVSLQTANALYKDTLVRGCCASPSWEEAFGACA